MAIDVQCVQKIADIPYTKITNTTVNNLKHTDKVTKSGYCKQLYCNNRFIS